MMISVRVMQLVDYWVGIPLCAALSLLRRIFPFPSWRSHAPERILLIELSEMGSAIISHSAIEELRAHRPNAELYFLIFRKNKESVEILGSIPPTHLITIDERSFIRFITSAVRTIVRLWRLRITTVIDLELFSRATMIISFLSGAPRRIGFSNFTSEGLYRGALLTHPVYYNHHQHMAYNFIALARAATLNSELPAIKEDVRQFYHELPLFTGSATELHAMEETLRTHNLINAPLVLVNPDPGDMLPIRGWPVARYEEVVRQLLARYPTVQVAFIGLPHALPMVEEMLRNLQSPRCHNFVGVTHSLRELLVLCNKSAVLLTNDGGPAHMAALTSIHSVVLFGPETPALYGPLGSRTQNLYAHYSCSPCLNAANHRHTICTNNRCLQAIQVHEVVSAVGLALEKSVVNGALSR